MKRTILLLALFTLFSVPVVAGDGPAADKGEITQEKLARNVKLGPIEFGDYNADQLTLLMRVSVKDLAAAAGGQLEFGELRIAGIPFTATKATRRFDVPASGTKAWDRPLELSTPWTKAVSGALGKLRRKGGTVVVAGEVQARSGPRRIQVEVPVGAGKTLDGLITRYGQDRMGPTLEEMGIDPDEVDAERMLELLREWAGDGIEAANPCANPCAKADANPCANPCAGSGK